MYKIKKNKSELGQFPFLNMVGGKSISLVSKINEAEGVINDISTLITQTDEETSPNDRKIYKKNLKLKLLSHENLFITEEKKTEYPGLKEIKVNQSRFSKVKTNHTLPNIKPLNTVSDTSFEGVASKIPLKKFKTRFSSRISIDKTISTRTSIERKSLLKLPTFKSTNNSKYISIENSINEIMEACKGITITTEEKNDDFSKKFPEIDYIRNLVGVRGTSERPGVFVHSKGKHPKYLSLNKDNIFQMCHYMNVITPKQSYSNKELYMSRFGMKKEKSISKGEIAVSNMVKKLSDLNLTKVL
jgi:hypothetical protein